MGRVGRSLVLLLVFVVGVQIGTTVERARRSAGERAGVQAGPPPTTSGTAPAAPLAGLQPRCTNGDPPQEWTRVDAEAALHAARMSLETARHYQVPALKQAWALEAIAGYLYVLACLPPVEGPR